MNKKAVNRIGSDLQLAKTSLLDAWNSIPSLKLNPIEYISILLYFKAMSDIPTLLPDYESIQ